MVNRIHCVAAAIVCGLLLAPTVSAQLLQPLGNKKAPQASAESADIKSAIRAIYESTRSAESGSDLEAISARCRKLIEGSLVEKDRRYLESLIGWAENRLAGKMISESRAMQEMGLSEQADERLLAAVEKLDQIIELYPLTWRAWMSRGRLHAESNEYEQALKMFREVVRLNGRSAAARFNCAELELQLGKYRQAIEDYTVLIEDDPTDVQALTGRGHCYLELDEIESAADDYHAVLQLRPGDRVARLNAKRFPRPKPTPERSGNVSGKSENPKTLTYGPHPNR